MGCTEQSGSKKPSQALPKLAEGPQWSRHSRHPAWLLKTPAPTTTTAVAHCLIQLLSAGSMGTSLLLPSVRSKSNSGCSTRDTCGRRVMGIKLNGESCFALTTQAATIVIEQLRSAAINQKCAESSQTQLAWMAPTTGTRYSSGRSVMRTRPLSIASSTPTCSGGWNANEGRFANAGGRGGRANLT